MISCVFTSPCSSSSITSYIWNVNPTSKLLNLDRVCSLHGGMEIWILCSCVSLHKMTSHALEFVMSGCTIDILYILNDDMSACATFAEHAVYKVWCRVICTQMEETRLVDTSRTGEPSRSRKASASGCELIRECLSTTQAWKCSRVPPQTRRHFTNAACNPLWTGPAPTWGHMFGRAPV